MNAILFVVDYAKSTLSLSLSPALEIHVCIDGLSRKNLGTVQLSVRNAIRDSAMNDSRFGFFLFFLHFLLR